MYISNSQSTATGISTSTFRRKYVLLSLVVVYLFNFIDRQMIGILAPGIKAEMGLSDTQLGLLTGLAFALMYSVTGVPVARLADRYSRVRIMAIALAVWSGFTVLCGFAFSFPQLFFARLGVGIGEAGGAAPAFSIIADYFPPHARARALAIFGLGVPLGIASGVLLGARLARVAGWRSAFIVVGVAGMLLAVLFLLTVAEPRRGQFDAVMGESEPSFREVLIYISRKPSFWGLLVATSLSASLIYGLAFWVPSYFARSYHLPLTQVSYLYSAQILVGYTGGLLLGGWFGDRLGYSRPSAYALIPAVCFALATPFYALALLASSSMSATVLMMVPQALSSAWVGPVFAAIQRLAPPTMRTTVSALFLMLQNLIGLGGGALFLGLLSDHYFARYGTESLRYSIMTGLILFPLSSVAYAVTARRLHTDLL